MARCRECGNDWVCSDPDEVLKEFYSEKYIPCGTCRCPDCMKKESPIIAKDLLNVSNIFARYRNDWNKWMEPINMNGDWWSENWYQEALELIEKPLPKKVQFTMLVDENDIPK